MSSEEDTLILSLALIYAQGYSCSLLWVLVLDLALEPFVCRCCEEKMSCPFLESKNVYKGLELICLEEHFLTGAFHILFSKSTHQEQETS